MISDGMLRGIFAILIYGPSWYLGMMLMFVWSGAQQILANPESQSEKFISAFALEPLPRMASDTLLPLKGLFIAGLFGGAVLFFLNDKIKGGWLRKGFVFGCISWAFAIPWFEFYLPYNVMLEPLPLVLLEGFLWFVALQLAGMIFSAVMNFGKK